MYLGVQAILRHRQSKGSMKAQGIQSWNWRSKGRLGSVTLWSDCRLPKGVLESHVVLPCTSNQVEHRLQWRFSPQLPGAQVAMAPEQVGVTDVASVAGNAAARWCMSISSHVMTSCTNSMRQICAMQVRAHHDSRRERQKYMAQKLKLHTWIHTYMQQAGMHVGCAITESYWTCA